MYYILTMVHTKSFFYNDHCFYNNNSYNYNDIYYKDYYNDY